MAKVLMVSHDAIITRPASQKTAKKNVSGREAESVCAGVHAHTHVHTCASMCGVRFWFHLIHGA